MILIDNLSHDFTIILVPLNFITEFNIVKHICTWILWSI